MKKYSKSILTVSTIAMSAIFLQGCTKLQLVPAPDKIQSVCIVHNKKVIVKNFEKTLSDQLHERGIQPSIVAAKE